MKIISSVIFIVLFSGAANAEILDFEFMDNSGKVFRTTRLLTQLEEEYNFKYEEMSVLLMLTPSLTNEDYLDQNDILNTMEHGEAEELQLMYVTSCWTGEYKHGYHTSLKTAESLAGNNLEFRIIIMNVNGRVFFEGSNPISAEKIRIIINRN